MSRTYRNGIDWAFAVHGERIKVDYTQRLWGRGWTYAPKYVKNRRDGNTGVLGSPTSPWVKRLYARTERRHMNWAVRDGKELPTFKHSVRYDWW